VAWWALALWSNWPVREGERRVQPGSRHGLPHLAKEPEVRFAPVMEAGLADGVVFLGFGGRAARARAIRVPGGDGCGPAVALRWRGRRRTFTVLLRLFVGNYQGRHAVCVPEAEGLSCWGARRSNAGGAGWRRARLFRGSLLVSPRHTRTTCGSRPRGLRDVAGERRRDGDGRGGATAM
jgi:hypothetical protein